MSIPDFQTLMLPVLRAFAAGAENVAQIAPTIKTQFSISETEAAELIPSGRISTLLSRVHWARTYLGKAGLIESPKRNSHKITDRGRKLLAQNPAFISIQTLEQFADFSAWRAASLAPKSQSDKQDHAGPMEPANAETPEEQMRRMAAILEDHLVDQILSLMAPMSPQQFEQLILDLLAAMGFGGGQRANGRMTPTTGDGGIDGIIHEDALGLDAVYIQAKRYAPDNKISRPDIQRFVGSLTGESATKGVFVTTSDFSKEARDYISRVQQRIVLINGRRLAELMILHGVGVRTRYTYAIRDIDQDYFVDPES